MALQKDTQEGDAKAQLLAEAFQKEGLDAGFWLPKVSQILGIKCREALQHLEYEDYLKLECEIRHPWEKKALRKLLKITDDKTASEELQKEQLENTKQWQEMAKQALKGLTEMLNSRSHSQEALRKKAETLWQAMEIPKEFWPSPEEPLVEMLESIHKQLEQQQELSAGRRENIPDTEVLRRASGGLALQGIYRTSRAGDVLATREQLLRVPEGFQLAGPEQGSLLVRREFSSSAEESTFTKSMEQLGFSLSVSAKFAFWGMNLGAGVDHSSSSQSRDTHRSHSEQSYFCTTKFQYIPLASCYFQRHQLRLSEAALRELQDMEQILGVTGKEDNPSFVNMCERFFSRFGSHINQGPLHFGGIFWWKASTEGFRAEQREEVKRQTSAALNSFVGASWGGIGVSLGGPVDVSKSSSQASVQGSAQGSSDTAIQLYMVNTGGPADAASLPQWKTGLVSDNTTWCVIDRGFELIPVWDVILCNHCEDFTSVDQMSRALRDAYKALTNETIRTIFGEELGSAVQEARDVMATVKASFKNSLEIAAYRKLENAFSEWTWRLRSHFLDVQMRLNNKIQNGDLQNVTREHLEGLVQETSDAIEKEVEKYFREDKDHETLVQWKSSTELKLKELKESLLQETKQKCENLIELQKEQRKLDARKLEYEAELLRRSRELAMSLKGKSLSERELKDNFSLVWNSWIAEVSRAAHPPERVDIDAEVKDVLLGHFKEPDFHERIRSFSKDRGFSFDMNKHIMHKKYLDFVPDSKSIYTSHVNRFQHLKVKEFLDLIEESRSILNADVINLQHITDDIIARVKANIDKKEQEKQVYSQNFFHEILNEVQRGVDCVPSDEKWTFNREYSIDLSLYLCRMAAERFKAMQEAFQKENDPVVYLSSKRNYFFQCFQISYQ